MILLGIALVWLTVIVIVLSACRMAAAGDQCVVWDEPLSPPEPAPVPREPMVA